MVEPSQPDPSRFVLLRHEMPALAEAESHWDLMLERATGLLTLRFMGLPSGSDATPQVVATRLADHRRVYLDYEGPVSGDRGRVWRLADGLYDYGDPADDAPASENDPDAACSGPRLRLQSEQLQAEFQPENCVSLGEVTVGQSLRLRVLHWQLSPQARRAADRRQPPG